KDSAIVALWSDRGAARPALHCRLQHRGVRGAMQEFDPRLPPVRYAPRIIICVVGVASLIAAWQLTVHDPHKTRPSGMLDHAAALALQNEASARAEAQPGFGRPENVSMKIAPGETFEQAVLRLGVAPAEAQQVVRTLSAAFDTVNIKAG